VTTSVQLAHLQDNFLPLLLLLLLLLRVLLCMLLSPGTAAAPRLAVAL
jgi:hypothetical protein